MQIDNLTKGMSNYNYYNPDFRNVLEDHMTYLRNHASTRLQTVDSGIAYRFESDFYGLLNYYNIDYYLHFIILRMNGMTDPIESSADLQFFIYPDPDVVAQINSVESATNRLNG